MEEGSLYLFSDIVYSATFRYAANSCYMSAANSFSQKFVILNDILCEFLHGLAKHSLNYCFD